tara:strand:+ start:4640 stop:4864 length:225 start_codon:yes stop_codon:yes gene_type:complete
MISNIGENERKEKNEKLAKEIRLADAEILKNGTAKLDGIFTIRDLRKIIKAMAGVNRANNMGVIDLFEREYEEL